MHVRSGWPKSIFTRMFLVICAAAIPALAGLSYYVHQQRTNLIEFNEERASQYVELAVHDENRLFHDTEQLFKVVGSTAFIRDQDWEHCHGFMQRLLKTEPFFRDIGIFSPDGPALCSAQLDQNALEGLDFADRPYFKRALKNNGTVLGEFYIGRITEAPIFVIAQALRTPDGKPYAILYASLNPLALGSNTHGHGLGPNSESLLLDRNNVILKARPDNTLYGSTLSNPTIFRLLTSSRAGSNIVKRADGRDWLVSHSRAGTRADPDAITLVHMTPARALLGRVNQALWLGAVLTVLITALTLGLGWWGLQTFVGRNVRVLAQAAKRLGQRTYDQPVTPQISGAEFQAIATEIDKVAIELDQLEQHWETSLAQRQSEVGILRLIANDHPLDECLTALVNLIEDQTPDSLAHILILDKSGTHIEACIAPRLPASLHKRLQGATVSPELGWHVQGILQKRAIISADVASDPLWNHPDDRALQSHIATSWSYPIIATDNARTAFGAINVYLRNPYTPTDADLNLSRMAAGLAIIAVTQLRQHESLQYQSRHDPVTGLFNRHTLSSYISLAIRRAKTANSRFSVLMLDLDGFKEVNNTLGNELGDLLLTQAGQRLQEIVGDLGYVGRSGNDEYIIQLQQQHEHDQYSMLHSLLHAMRQPFNLQGIRIQISASIGVACYPESGTNLQSLLRHAEAAMYKARTEGSGFLFYDLREEEKTSLHIMTLSGLRSALHNQEFVLHFQPKIHLDNGRAFSVEALIRWQHPDKGLLGPQDFISVAELSDIIHPLTLWVIEDSVRRCAKWRDQGHLVSISVNISTRNLMRKHLPVQIREILARHRFPPHALTLEVTESAIMDDINRALPVLQSLRAMGVQLSLDDFGTGYSSLAYLRRLPVDNIKIDRSFITSLDQKPEDREIVMTIIKLAQSLRLSVTAEGVENDSVLKLLRRMGCNYAQGFGIARPMPPEQLANWLAENARLNPPEPGLSAGQPASADPDAAEPPPQPT